MNKQGKLIINVLNSLRKLINYTYYSGVFIIDAKESAMLFTQAIHIIRNGFVQEQQTRIVEEIINKARLISLGSSKQQIEQNLYDCRIVLQYLLSLGWDECTIQLQKNGVLEIKQVNGNQQDRNNQYFDEIFDRVYTQVLQQYFDSSFRYQSPLTPLINQINHEHNILNYLSSKSEKYVMQVIEGECIKKVVKILEDQISFMMDNNQDESLIDLDCLFRQLQQSYSSEYKPLNFQVASQFLNNIDDINILPVKPFQILALMLRKFFITHPPFPATLDNLICFMAKYQIYIKRIFDDNQDILYGYKSALEIIINEQMNIMDQLLIELLKDDETNQVYHHQIVMLLHSPTFITKYARLIIDNLLSHLNPENLHYILKTDRLIQKIQQLRQCFKNQDNNDHKLKLLIYMIQSFQKQYNQLNGIVYLTIPQFFLLEQDFIEFSLLPKKLQALCPNNNRILLKYGFGIINYKGVDILINNAQLILIQLIQEQKGDINQLKQIFNEFQFEIISDAIITLTQIGLIKNLQDHLQLNSQWQSQQKFMMLINKKQN